MEIEQIKARLTGDATQFVAEFNRAGRAMGGLTMASGQSNRALGILRNGMVGLATQATGTVGPIGKLAQGLLMFGGGSGLVLGVAAGIGAIALAYNAFTRDAREAKEANDEFMLSLAKVGPHARAVIERNKLATLEGDLAKLERDVAARSPGGRVENAGFQDALRLKNLRTEIAGQTLLVAQREREARVEMDRQLGVLGRIRDTEAERYRAALAAMEKLVMNAKLFKDEIETAVMKLAELESGGKARAAEETFMRFGFGGQKRGMGTKELIEETFQPTELEKQIRNLGISLGRQFAMALIEGIEDMQDVLRMIFMAILDFAIGAALNSIIPGAGAAAGAVGGGGKFSGNVVAPASMSLQLPPMQPLTAFALARDPGWQAALREGLVVASAAGFKSR